MLHVGLDLSRTRLDVHVMDQTGTPVAVTTAAPDVGGLASLAYRLGEFGQPVTAVIESMNGARFIHDQLELRGWTVEIADAVKVKGFAPLACKTDKIDAWVLAELSRRDLVPAIWLPSPDVRANRERARWRLHLMRHHTAAAARRREAELSAHTRAECALRDHPALGRWLRPDARGRLVIDTAKVRAEARLDGKYLLVTSDPDLSAEHVALGYKNLLEAEHGFRDMKSTLELRPVYHRLEPRIRAHVLLCWLALLLIRVGERRTGSTWPALARELGRLHAVTLTGPTGTVTQTTELTTAQQGILRACGLTPPPRITALQPT